MKETPKRTCMGCNEKKNKNELIRIVKNKNGEISIDTTGKMQGRGAYLCDNIECFEKIVKTKRIERIFQKKINNEIYDELRGVMIGKK